MGLFAIHLRDLPVEKNDQVWEHADVLVVAPEKVKDSEKFKNMYLRGCAEGRLSVISAHIIQMDA